MRQADPGCVFCRILSGELPSERLFEDDECLAFRDIAPAAPFHGVLVSRAHIASADALEEEEAALVGRMVLAARGIAREHGLVDPGYRLVMNTGAGAGQTVFHLHLHILGGREMGPLS